MSSDLNQNLSELLKNFIVSQEYVEHALIYSREGKLILKYRKIDLKADQGENIDNNHLPLSIIVEKLLNRLRTEYKLGHYGSGSFDTPDNRITYFEAGKKAILLCVCDFYINLDQLFPISYLVAEKIAQLVEGKYNPKFNSLTIPNLKFHDSFSIELSKYSSDTKEPIFDHVYHKLHVKREEDVIRIIKVIVLGSEAVGKTTLINSFLSKEQTSDYRPTIGVAISAQKYFLQGFKENVFNFLIYDLAGQKFFKRVRRDYYNGANCVLIVYDITRKETLEEAINIWYADAHKQLGDIPFFLIGNKIDLENDRQITREEGLKVAENLNCEFIETSALENINVKDTFNMIGIELSFKKRFP